MSQNLRQYINEHRSEIQREMQAIYAKHGITVENVSNGGANLRFTQGADALFNASVEEAEYLAGLVKPEPQETAPQGISEPDPEYEEQDPDDVPPSPPGAGEGKWVGKWTRTFTGTFTEEVNVE